MVVIGLALQSCKREEPEQTIRVATGAIEVLELDSIYCLAGEPQQGCLSNDLESLSHLVEVAIEGDAFVLHGDPVSDGWVLGIPVKAVAVGEATLVVRYLDHDEETVDRFVLSSLEITRVEASVACGSSWSGGRYAISTGSAFQFRLSAFAGANAVAYGDLELVHDDDGVSRPPPIEGVWFRDAVAPDEAGPRTWTLAGDSDPVEFLFYEAADLGASLIALDPRFEDGDLEVTQTVDGEPVCVHEGSAWATVAVTAGECRIAFDGFAFDGPMPIDLGQGAIELSLSGTDTCEVTATTRNNAPTLEVSVVDAPLEEVTGTPIGANPVLSEAVLPAREDCPEMRAPTDGSCELYAIPGVIVLPSPDCLFSSRWVFRHHDEYDNPVGSRSVGVGLTTEVQTGAEYQFLGFLDWSEIPTADLRLLTSSADIDDLGCVDDDRQAIALTVYDPGTIDLRFEASNIHDHGTLTVSAVEADHAEFDVAGVETLGDGDETRFFVGSVVPVSVTHFDAHSEKLVGIGPIGVATGDIGDAVLTGDAIHVGSTPGRLRLSSPNAPTEAVVRTVDDSAVTEVVAPPLTAVVGEIACFAPTALASNGDEIHGQDRSPIGIALTGESWVVSKREDDDGAINTICFRAFAPGTTAIDVTWGAATAGTEWVVR